MSAVKIDYITTHEPVSLPGPGTSKRWHVNSKIGSGTYAGQVKSIERDESGYWLEVGGGANAGYYHVPFQNVVFARGTPAHVAEAQVRADHAAYAKQIHAADVATTGDDTKPKKTRKSADA